MNEQNTTNQKKKGCCGIFGNCRICALIAAIICFLIGFWILSLTGWRWHGPTGGEGTSYKSATYQIEGSSVTLVNGVATSTSSTTRYFGNEAMGDLNADGKTDVAFLITQQPGGSGTFYYVTAALKTDTGYVGTNAIFLGDRIAPQNTTIRAGVITVNYADRKATDSMVTPPSIGVSRFFKVDNGQLVETK